MLQTFADVIDEFGGPAAFGREVGMLPNAAKQARRRNSLSARWFAATAAAAKRRGLQINERDLSLMAERRQAA